MLFCTSPMTWKKLLYDVYYTTTHLLTKLKAFEIPEAWKFWKANFDYSVSHSLGEHLQIYLLTKVEAESLETWTGKLCSFYKPSAWTIFENQRMNFSIKFICFWWVSTTNIVFFDLGEGIVRIGTKFNLIAFLNVKKKMKQNFWQRGFFIWGTILLFPESLLLEPC